MQGDILFLLDAILSFFFLTHIFYIKYYFSKNNVYFCTRILKRVLIYYMVKDLLTPDYIFEASWEVCNKVGGIYTVLSTRANTLQTAFRDKLFCSSSRIICVLLGRSMRLRKMNFLFVSDDGISPVNP